MDCSNIRRCLLQTVVNPCPLILQALVLYVFLQPTKISISSLGGLSSRLLSLHLHLQSKLLHHGAYLHVSPHHQLMVGPIYT